MDLPLIERPWASRNLIPWTIPMLFKKGFNWERRVAGYAVAPVGTVVYDETEGATWAG